jgi:hypothetical protein
MTTTSTRARTHDHLLSAARLGADVARADLAGSPQHASSAMASWRRLRRHADRDTRALLRIAFDTGYGQEMRLSEPVTQM